MDSDTGGQSSSDLQKQAAAAIARKKVLAAYAESAKKAARDNVNKAHMKDEPVVSKINSESWKQYHSAWQNYYQKYYSEYYSRAAKDYVAKERLKDAREKAEEEEILSSLAKASKLGKKSGFSLKTNSNAQSNDSDVDEQDSIRAQLRSRIRKKATESAKKTHDENAI